MRPENTDGKRDVSAHGGSSSRDCLGAPSAIEGDSRADMLICIDNVHHGLASGQKHDIFAVMGSNEILIAALGIFASHSKHEFCFALLPINPKCEFGELSLQLCKEALYQVHQCSGRRRGNLHCFIVDVRCFSELMLTDLHARLVTNTVAAALRVAQLSGWAIAPEGLSVSCTNDKQHTESAQP